MSAHVTHEMKHPHGDKLCRPMHKLELIKQGLSWPGKQRTLHVSRVPLVFREPYVATGYRPPDKPWSYYLVSVCELHNESVNVWTHLLAFVAVLAQLYRLSGRVHLTQHKDAQTLIGFSVGCLLNTLLSAAAHLLHSKSAWWHYVWFLIDYAGVTYYSFATVLGCVYVSSHPLVYSVIEPCVLPINIALSSFGFLTCCLAKLRFSDPYQPQRQRLMVAGLGVQALVGASPVLARFVHCLHDDHCSLSSLNHISVVFLLLAVCAVTFSAHLPEKLWVGQFDLFGQGHQIFHVVSMVTMVMELEGMYIDIKNGAAQHTSPDLKKMLAAYLVLVIIHVAILVSLKGHIQNKVNDVLEHIKDE
ncbi:membrane progestin receptor alpha-B-like isoform X2 [Gigantopelta aegis]|uniref:membrane progestin receptor alpha-B-like isoform X2 n=1 Tax=Gigantopelta aegis TaxID=1735272 RepID=UPI001B88A58A|nr:membrane progestin receptor alpha-B-like isoform X2 [Gigantopelta aegis]